MSTNDSTEPSDQATDAVVLALVRRTTAASGVPLFVDDAVAIDEIVRAMAS